MGRGGHRDPCRSEDYKVRIDLDTGATIATNHEPWEDMPGERSMETAVGSQDLRASTEDPGLRLQGGHQRAGNLGRIGSPRNVCTKGCLYQLPDCEPSIATECVHERTEGLERQIADTDVSHSSVKQ